MGVGGHEQRWLCGDTTGFPGLEEISTVEVRRWAQTLCPKGTPRPCAGGKLCFLLGKTPQQQISAKVRERDPCWHQRLLRPHSFLPQRQRAEAAAKANSIQQAAPSRISHPRSLAVPASAAFLQEGPD